MINYHNKLFKPVSQTENGQVDENTIFHYEQYDRYICGKYKGGSIRIGMLIGEVRPDGKLSFDYSHYDNLGEYRSGHCVSYPERLPNGKIRLREKWQWTAGDKGNGESIIEEV